jgi:hypothetical protein
MDYKGNIIMSVAEKGCKQVSGKVVRELRKMTASMQLGDDSPLKNIWDEVCVHVQGQESVMWEFYLEVIRGLIRNELKLIDSETEQAMWFQTDQGADWDMNTEWKIQNEEDDIPEKMAVNEDDITEYILNEYILKAAAGWKNKRIEKFLERGMDLDE